MPGWLPASRPIMAKTAAAMMKQQRLASLFMVVVG